MTYQFYIHGCAPVRWNCNQPRIVLDSTQAIEPFVNLNNWLLTSKCFVTQTFFGLPDAAIPFIVHLISGRKYISAVGGYVTHPSARSMRSAPKTHLLIGADVGSGTLVVGAFIVDAIPPGCWLPEGLAGKSVGTRIRKWAIRHHSKVEPNVFTFRPEDLAVFRWQMTLRGIDMDGGEMGAVNDDKWPNRF
jgi:hypothetical protein